ncbi:MAG TPA: alginate export family protein [Pyrinomonadaceae bacterium]|jgi:hypothetical protein
MRFTLDGARRTGARLALLVFCVALFGAHAAAQTQPAPPADAKPPAQSQTNAPAPTPAPVKLGSVPLAGSVRARVESWSWFETPEFEDAYAFGAVTLRLSLGQQRDRLDWLVEGEFPALYNLPARAVAPGAQGQLGLGATYRAASGRQDASAVLKQAFIRFKGIAGDKASSLRVGRFEFSEGAEVVPKDATLALLKREHVAQRLVGPFGFSHVGRSFDGVQYVRNTRINNLTIVGARATEGVFQLNGNRELDVDFIYGAYTRQLPATRAQGELRAFALHYHDGRGALKADNRSLAARRADTDNIRVTTVGGHYIGAFKSGRDTADVLLWGAAQFGRWGRLDQRAGAFAAEAGYKFAARFSPWVRAGYFRSTGDDDPADDRNTTFFQVLPTPRTYARFPFYNAMNSEDLFAQLRLAPHARVNLRADARRLRLTSANDLWYAGGGAFQEQTFGYTGRPGGGRRSLGTLFDLSADFNFAPNTVVTVYVSGVRGGDVIRFIYPAGGENPTARFIYLEFVQRF